MSTISQTIGANDYIFATLTAQGKVLRSIYCNNFSSLNEIIKSICAHCTTHMGLTQLNIRNQTQGWSTTLSLMLGATTANRRKRHEELPHDGAQYRLPW